MRGHPRRASTVAAVALALAALGGCTDPSGSDAASEPAVAPSASIRTLTPVPLPPDPPPSGRLRAEIRQSSRDAALGRAQVWLENDTARTLLPRAVAYREPALRTALVGDRLRPIPSQTERGFPLRLPRRPACARADRTGVGILTVRHAGVTSRVRAHDPTDVIGRHVASRCLELAVARTALVSWSPTVRVDRPGAGSIGSLVLVVRPTGRDGPPLRIDEVSGTPLLTPADSDVWRPDLVVRAGAPPVRLALPMRPARCDGHAFLESGGATAFRVHLRLGDRVGELVLRMSPRGAAAAIGFARRSCGLDG